MIIDHEWSPLAIMHGCKNAFNCRIQCYSYFRNSEATFIRVFFSLKRKKQNNSESDSGATSQNSFWVENWASCIPDLILLDYKMWLKLKNVVCKVPYKNWDSLKNTLSKATSKLFLKIIRATIADWSVLL